MKKLLILTALFVMLAVSSAWAQALWHTSGLLTNPATGDILADSQPLTAGAYAVIIVASSSVAAAVDLQVRDTTNTVTVQSQRLQLLASGTQVLGEFHITVLQDQRIRVIMSLAVLGTAQASIFRRQ